MSKENQPAFYEYIDALSFLIEHGTAQESRGAANALAIYAQRKAEKVEAAAVDSLTQVLARDELLEQGEILIQKLIAREADRGSSHTPVVLVAFCDIINFTAYNKEPGLHEFGDTVLENFGGILRTSLRKEDLVGRWGGEEFVFIMPIKHLDQRDNAEEAFKRRIAGAKQMQLSIIRNRIEPSSQEINAVSSLRYYVGFSTMELGPEADLLAAIRQADPDKTKTPGA